ncbi:phosphoribosylformylglycinamidine cyclo-ligase [Candidatus Nitrosacidococcus tergens]|uniref:Phosphoribosylformylglycinamidine cyclo-ligase n=1 Tax=Candidatus Nitrosacidococcus tergens TaxID=553981 RepID=A0A7G1QA87_9GAMM|nr:phosphoribosylformylglycinamidine cyclo-ligase [Candidatus Nitrosacidococcus tergens]CAB1276487.1 phosphoribosylaminoimidazole synthetase [Candidatus Nitrosacidococcus tergens]
MNEKKVSSPSLSYRSAGVDIDAGNRLVDQIRPAAARTTRPEVLAGLGGFASLFELPIHRYQNPILVASTDGVGTKLKLAIQLGVYDTIGTDLVAMCVNDIIVQGAEPLFFLDYYATGKLNIDEASQVIHGISHGCTLAGAALVGGETAEMPGIYQGNDYDLAGFCVGIVEKNALIDGSEVQLGDNLIGIASSGPHANGYSLIRKIIEQGNWSLDTSFDNQTLGSVLITPTRIYVKPLLELFSKVQVHAVAHITGGGLLENLPRVLPIQLSAEINISKWVIPSIFRWLQQQGNLSKEELYRTFNCGIGMVVCVSEAETEKTLACLEGAGETAWVIGKIIEHQAEMPRITLC